MILAALPSIPLPEETIDECLGHAGISIWIRRLMTALQEQVGRPAAEAPPWKALASVRPDALHTHGGKRWSLSSDFRGKTHE